MKASPPEDSVFTLFPLLLSFTSEVKTNMEYTFVVTNPLPSD